MQRFGRRPLLAAVAVAGIVATFDLAAPPRQSVGTAASVSVIEPAFSVSWRRGQLQMRGHTFSLQHEKELMRLARASFSSEAVVSNFEPLGVVPDFWTKSTLELLQLLHGSASGQATISPAAAQVDVVTHNVEKLEQRVAAFRSSLPADIEVQANILPFDADFSVTDACAGAFSNFAAGAISFEENNAVLRPSAYPRLNRVAGLANQCRGAVIEIVGHTDSSGADSWNTSLSLQRAEAVAEVLVAAGVERQRLRVKGAGSSNPIASNATRYGRSINRRIEIEFVRD